MYADARLSAAMESMMRGIAAPSAPIGAIRARMGAAPAAPTPRRLPLARYAIAAAAAIALFCAIFPKTSLAVVGRFERIVVDSYAAAYKIMGWTPPPGPSNALDKKSGVTQTGSLAEAQSRATFRIVPPAGLPPGLVSAKIQTNRSLIYEKATHSWSEGPVVVWFTYGLSNGSTLQLMAEEYDPRTASAGGPPTKYMFEAEDLPHGRVALTKYEHYAWRNGDQLMSATEGHGITGREIEAIRDAMHGVELKAWEPGAPNTETIEKRYRLP